MTSTPARTDAGGAAAESPSAHCTTRRSAASSLADVTLAPPALWDFPTLAGVARSEQHHVLRLLSPSLTGGASARDTATAWLGTGALTVESTPGLYLWRWSQQGRSVVGVAGALELPTTRVWPHEQVRPGLLAERAAELGAGAVQPEPILLLYDGDQPLTPEHVAAAPLVDLRVADGRHEVQALTDPVVIDRVSGALAGESLVVADGHHRFAVLSRLPAPRPRAFVLVVDRRRSELTVGPIPRVAPGIGWEAVVSTPGVVWVELGDDERDEFLTAVHPERLRWVVADRTRTVGLEMSSEQAGALGPGAAAPCGPIARDVCYLHEHLLPSWGVAADRVSYAHSWPSALAQAHASAGLVLLSKAPRLDEVMAAALAGIVLPHKATSIAPKPRAGLLMLGDEIAPP